MPPEQRDDELRLIDACIAREPGAFDRLVDRNRRLLGHAVRAVLARWGALEDRDLFDEAFGRSVAALAEDDMRVLRGFGGRSRLGTYLVVVARRVAQRTVEERRTRCARLGVPGESATEPVDRDLSPPE